MRKISLKDLIRPKKVEVEGTDNDATYGKFKIEPLERGFGVTIGNGLRRTLLSALEGAAVTALKVEGVMHEFSTIPGVVEDVADIVLNLKGLRFRLDDKESAFMRVEVEGPCDVKAGMLTGDGSVFVVNKDAHIATLGAGSTLNMTLHIKRGRGYVTADRHKQEGDSEGTIYVDSIFAPVRRVNHQVINSRVGQHTDYDKLVLEIWTDGTVDARFALAQASHILMDQLGVFVGDELIIEEEEQITEEPKTNLNENLFRRIDEIELTVRSANCLENSDIKYIGELVQRSEAEMLRTKNFGRKSLNEIKEILGEMGLSLGMKIDGFPGRTHLERQVETVSASN
jgi:DNA-directed RNA polymerase subunit alpha